MRLDTTPVHQTGTARDVTKNEEALPTIAARYESLQTLVGELLLKNQKLRLKVAQLEEKMNCGAIEARADFA